MIFEELIIHNFGIYKGRHQINLSPKSEKKPIILFGGLNGGGKTTFLDALQLTLYGKFAQCSNRGSLSYHDYLRETINRHIKEKEGTSLELKFSTYIDGILNTYQVKRFWRSTGKTIKEEMEVIHNGNLDPVMTEQWYEYVNEFIPLSISGLFFFDGEKIEALADPDGSANLIKTGITSLLGLDIVDKLGSDLSALLRVGLNKDKKKSINENDAKVKDTAAEIKVQEELFSKLMEDREDLIQKIGNTATQIDSLSSKIKQIKSQYRQAGGDLFDQRESLESNLKNTQSALALKENELRHLAEGIAPLSLVENLINQAQAQAESEAEGRETKLLLDKLKQRDETLLADLKSTKLDSKAFKLVKSQLEKDISAREAQIPAEFYLGTSADKFYELEKTAFKKVKQSSKKLCKEVNEIQEQHLNIVRQIASIPEGEILKTLQQQLAQSEQEIVQETAKNDLLSDQLKQTNTQVERSESRLTNLRLSNNQNKFDEEFFGRISNNIGSVQNILTKFHHAMVSKHIKHLESLIFESFISLVRKTDLIKQITIEPESYKLTLLDHNYEAIQSNRLSAGERQILAISILWGLAKASGRPLPAIIDTPLGRLDSKHRQQLVDNYFPNASHQVILLSTDQEIDKTYRDGLKKYIGREYHIQYDKGIQSSTITEGYF